MDIKKPRKNLELEQTKSEQNGIEDPQRGLNGDSGGNKNGVLDFFVDVVKIVLLALLIIVPIRVFIFQPFVVKGASMEPNFHNGEYLIVNEFGYKRTVVAVGDKEFFTVDSFKDLKRGDPVVFRYPANPKEYFIKRIIGLPEDKVSIKNGLVMIYNEENPEGLILDETDYLPTFIETDANKGNDSEFVLGDDEYFVLGDNRYHSSDSRTWGALPGAMIMGKVLLRALPLDKFKLF